MFSFPDSLTSGDFPPKCGTGPTYPWLPLQPHLFLFSAFPSFGPLASFSSLVFKHKTDLGIVLQGAPLTSEHSAVYLGQLDLIVPLLETFFLQT